MGIILKSSILKHKLKSSQERAQNELYIAKNHEKLMEYFINALRETVKF